MELATLIAERIYNELKATTEVIPQHSVSIGSDETEHLIIYKGLTKSVEITIREKQIVN